MFRDQGDTKLDLGSTKNYFGEHKENNSGSWEKRVKFQREPGADDAPLRGLPDCTVFTKRKYTLASKASTQKPGARGKVGGTPHPPLSWSKLDLASF